MDLNVPLIPLLPFRKYKRNHDQRGRFTTRDSAPVTSDAWDVKPDTKPSGDRMTPGSFNPSPMTDDEYARHLKHVEEELALAEKMKMPDTQQQFDMIDGKENIYSEARSKIHDQIIADYMDSIKDVPRDHKGIIMAGLGGAGKSSSLAKNAQSPDSVAGRMGIKFASYDADGNGVGDPINFAVLNPDNLKEQFARLKMIPKVDHLSPMESSTFAHEETSWLSKTIAAKVVAKGYNAIWDITMEGQKAGTKKGDEMKDKGYSLSCVLVDVPVQQSLDSAAFRHRKGQDNWNKGQGQGGRYVPSFKQKGSTDPEGKYQSINANAAYTLAQNGYFDKFIAIDNKQVTGPDGKKIWPGRMKDLLGFGKDDTMTAPRTRSMTKASDTSDITAACRRYHDGKISFDQLSSILDRRYAKPVRSDEGNRMHTSWESDDWATPGSWDEVVMANADGLISDDELAAIRSMVLKRK